MQRPRGDNQQRILDFIKSEIQTKGYPPSVREIAQAVGLKSTSTVHGHLQRLEKRGLLHRDAMKPRAMEVTGDPNFIRNNSTAVPVVGRVTAGQPIFAEENLEEYVPIPDIMLGEGEHFILHVKGDSMIEAGILDGDYIIVRKTSEASVSGCRDWYLVDQFTDPMAARSFLLELFQERLDALGFDIIKDVQVLTPTHKGPLGTKELNEELQRLIQRKLGHRTTSQEA